MLGSVAFQIPHSEEVKAQVLEGDLLKELGLKDSRGFRKSIEDVYKIQAKSQGGGLAAQSHGSHSDIHLGKMLGTVPVSYTHLDVYKRQVQYIQL